MGKIRVSAKRSMAVPRTLTATAETAYNGLYREGRDVLRPNAKELKEMPLYSPAEAAHFLRLPASTVRAWAFGQAYNDARGGKHRFEPVIHIADRKNRRLSFINLIEISVLAAVRRIHNVPLPKVREAVGYLREHFPSPHPLADHKFQTKGVDLLVEKFGEIVNITKGGQIEMKHLIDTYLRGVERNTQGVPIKLHLPARGPDANRPGEVVIDPRRGFGRPVLDRVGVRTEVVVQRFRAGEAINSLAQDYALAEAVIEDIIRSELPIAA